MSSVVHLPLLDNLQLAYPCPARWEDMTGDERVRHCAQCDLDVHNISEMTRDEAEGALAKIAEGRVCARFYKRADGTILTRDCPVGLAAVRAKARRALVRVATLVGLASVTGVAAGAAARGTWGDRVRLRALRPFSIVCEWIAPGVAPAPPVNPGQWLGGLVCPTPPMPAPSGGPMQPSGQGSTIAPGGSS